VRDALLSPERVVVLEKALSVGHRRRASRRRAMALTGWIGSHGYTVIAGLGGRPITQRLAARAAR
jgi:hypothetical protein